MQQKIIIINEYYLMTHYLYTKNRRGCVKCCMNVEATEVSC